TFGLLELNEDDGVRALRAAAELATALRDKPGVEVRLATDAVDVIAPEGAAAAGAHAGAAIADLRALAASVEAGETAVGDALAALVRSSVRLTGANVLVEVPPDARAIPRRLDAPLVGRGRELDALLEEFRAARAERSCRLALVVGPAGIGKSRLAGELRAVVERDALVLVGRCSPFGEQRASQPLAELVAGAAGGTSVALLVEALGDVPGAPMLAETIAPATGRSSSWSTTCTGATPSSSGSSTISPRSRPARRSCSSCSPGPSCSRRTPSWRQARTRARSRSSRSTPATRRTSSRTCSGGRRSPTTRARTSSPRPRAT